MSAHRLSLRLLLLPALASTLACGDGPNLGPDAKPDAAHAILDADAKVPVGEDAPPPAAATSSNTQDPSDCGPRTGRKPDGTCEFLSTRDVGYAQQVLLPAGEFVMGMLPLKHDGSAARSNPAILWPYQPPRLAKAPSVWIDLHEVRRDEYEKCVADGACTPAQCPDGGVGLPPQKLDESMLGRVPQTCVSHAQATAFCESKGQRLPTEIEWEYAARGPDGRTHPWGEEVRDELGVGLVPVGMPVDHSYFGLMGFGSSGAEWTADEHRGDRGLDAFVQGEFRSPTGPLAKEAAAWWERHACAKDQSCEGGRAKRYVIKGPVPGHARAAHDATIESTVSPGPATMTIEGWDEVHAHRSLSFRCAGDRKDGDPELTLPEQAPAIPYTASHDGLEVFGAVAEAVSKSEAKAFCGTLSAPDASGATQTDWRLPNRAELLRLAPVFRGPGPFWGSDGGMQQDGPGWVELDAKADEALLARCIRG